MSSSRGGTIKWVLDDNGTITNFNIKTLRTDIMNRLQNGSPLYTLEECKTLVVEIARLATLWQEEELSNLIFLNQLHQKVLPTRNANYQWPVTVTPHIPFSKANDVLNDSAVYRINKVIEELNRSIVRMIDRLWNERRERLLLGARIMNDIESINSREDFGWKGMK
eukprot:Tbor_TRINITY_DN3635_c0_g1::TRINITY_DN3635_c0_g1_i1::g.209::m.209